MKSEFLSTYWYLVIDISTLVVAILQPEYVLLAKRYVHAADEVTKSRTCLFPADPLRRHVCDGYKVFGLRFS